MVDTPTIDVTKPNAYVKISVKVTDNFAGAYALSVGYLGPTGAPALQWETATAAPTTNGTLVAFAPLSSNTTPGTYTITELIVQDAAGNTIQYTSGITSLFGNKDTFSVVN